MAECSHIAGRASLRRFREELTDEERQIVDLRGDGLGWSEIATRLGGTAGARRMQLTRAIERVARSLGVESIMPD